MKGDEIMALIPRFMLNDNLIDDFMFPTVKERVYGKYQRSFYIGEIDKNAIEASFENGILKISMPKKEEEKLTSKKIEIK